MKRLKGPELKMPELKVPDVVADLFYDLRDRRLLPLIALVLVAIVAIPFLLGGGSDEVAVPPPGAAATAAQSSVGEAQLTVVESKPGLRDYRKRLAGRKPTDPFKQRYNGPVLTGAELKSQSTTSTSSTTTVESTSTTTTPTEVASPGGAPTSGEGGDTGGGSGGGSPQQITVFSFAIDVKISHTETAADGTTTMSEPATRKRVLPTTPLPGDKAPVITYMGLGKKPDHALLMVSSEVKSIYGDAECLSGTETCQLLEVETTFPETFVYGPNDVRYKVNVLKIEAVPVGRT
jgi:hypothetical protein